MNLSDCFVVQLCVQIYYSSIENESLNQDLNIPIRKLVYSASGSRAKQFPYVSTNSPINFGDGVQCDSRTFDSDDKNPLLNKKKRIVSANCAPQSELQSELQSNMQNMNFQYAVDRYEYDMRAQDDKNYGHRGISPEGLERNSQLYFQATNPYIVKTSQIFSQNIGKKQMNDRLNRKKDQLIRKARDIITTPGNPPILLAI